jgi:hypothetical protein
MSEQTDRYLAELETAEAEAAGLLERAGPDGEGLNGAGPVIRQLRAAVKRHSKEVERIRAEARAEARAELITERKREASFRRLGVPDGPARALFAEVDPADDTAMAARAAELRGLGITWNGQPPAAPAAPQPDPNVDTVAAMQLAAAGGNGTAAPFDHQMRAMAANPDNFTDEQRDRAVKDYNRAVNAAARNGAGALG